MGKFTLKAVLYDQRAFYESFVVLDCLATLG